MATTAGAIVTVVRDQIPDPVYDSNGNPTPAVDGQRFRAQTLFRWVSDGVAVLAQRSGWRITDWTAFASLTAVPTYAIDPKWITAEKMWHNGLQLWLAPEQYDVWPTPPTSRQGVQYSVHSLAAQLSVRIFPAPNLNDPTTTITQGGGIGATDTSMIVGSTAGFLAGGYVQVESELIGYGAMTTTTLSSLQRGQGGTSAVAHAAGVTVTHCSLWLSGPRMPMAIALSTDPIEVPMAFQPALQHYVLWRASVARQDDTRALMFNKDFEEAALHIELDPRWREDSQGTAMLPTGVPLRGGLNYTQGPWGVVVP